VPMPVTAVTPRDRDLGNRLAWNLASIRSVMEITSR
jgi:hypothetical protein